jgi:hypothetical protein
LRVRSVLDSEEIRFMKGVGSLPKVPGMAVAISYAQVKLLCPISVKLFQA